MATSSFSRRRFLGLAAGAACLPAIIPASALGRGGRPAPSERIVMGFIGLGSQGLPDMNLFINKDEVQVAAVCDINTSGTNYAGDELRGREPARQFVDAFYNARPQRGVKSQCAAYTDYRELLGRDDIDAICIALPDHWHAFMAVAAANAGKDMYCEKPLARTIYEGQQMVKAVRRNDRVFQLGSQQRSDARFWRAAMLALNGYLGDIKEVYADVGTISKPCPLGAEPEPQGFDMKMWLGNAPEAPYHHERVSGKYNTDGGTWRSWRDYSAGRISDWGAHNFDIGQWGLGMDGSGPVEIFIPDGKDVQHQGFRYSSGIVMHNAKGPHDGMVQFIGTTGWVGVDREHIWASDDRLLTMDFKPSDRMLYQSTDHRQDFLDAVRSRKRPIADVEVGYSTSTLYLLGEIALRLGRNLRWDPAKQQILDDAEATAMLTRPMRAPYAV